MSAQPVGLSLSQPIMSCAHDQQAIAAVEDPTATVAQNWLQKELCMNLDRPENRFRPSMQMLRRVCKTR